MRTELILHKRSTFGFTLAELLISLAVLGVIATFTIPKVLQSQQDGKFKAIGKESAAMIVSAYDIYRQRNGPSTGMKSIDLSPYMHYVKLDTSGTLIDSQQTYGNDPCNSTYPCLLLHNGATLMFDTNCSFGGTSSTHAVPFQVDPDGKVTDNTPNGPGKSVLFYLYYNGRIVTWKDMAPGSLCNGGTYGACPNCDPPWFGWD